MVEGYLWPQLYGIFSMVEGYPWPQTSELRDSGLCSISLSSFFRIPLQTITGSLGLLPQSSLPPILRQGHALGRLRYHTYKRVGAFSFLRNLQSTGLPHWQLQRSLAGHQLQVQLCMEPKVLLVALADRLQKRTLSPWRFMYIGQRGCLYPSRHI